MENNESSSGHEDPSFAIDAESNDIWSKFPTDLEEGHTENVGKLVAGVNKTIEKSTHNKRFQRMLIASRVTTWLLWTVFLGLTLYLLGFAIITLLLSQPIGEFFQKKTVFV